MKDKCSLKVVRSFCACQEVLPETDMHWHGPSTTSFLYKAYYNDDKQIHILIALTWAANKILCPGILQRPFSVLLPNGGQTRFSTQAKNQGSRYKRLENGKQGQHEIWRRARKTP